MSLINVVVGGITKFHESIHGPVPYVEGGEPALMETDDLEKKAYVIDDENEHTEVTEYWHEGGLVHRSVNMRLKKAIFADAELGNFKFGS